MPDLAAETIDIYPHSSGGWEVQDQGATDLLPGEDSLSTCRPPPSHHFHGGERKQAFWCLFF